MYDPSAASLYSGPRRERASVGLILAFAVIVLIACAVMGFVIMQVKTRVAQGNPVTTQAAQDSGLASADRAA